MTIEEAILILDPETSRDALWKYEAGEKRLEACNEACRVAVREMRKNICPRKHTYPKEGKICACTVKPEPENVKPGKEDVRCAWNCCKTVHYKFKSDFKSFSY